MTYKEIKELKALENKLLNKEIAAAKKYYDAIYFEKSRANLKNTSLLAKTRAYIAVMKGIISERKKDQVLEK